MAAELVSLRQHMAYLTSLTGAPNGTSGGRLSPNGLPSAAHLPADSADLLSAATSSNAVIQVRSARQCRAVSQPAILLNTLCFPDKALLHDQQPKKLLLWHAVSTDAWSAFWDAWLLLWACGAPVCLHMTPKSPCVCLFVCAHLMSYQQAQSRGALKCLQLIL